MDLSSCEKEKIQYINQIQQDSYLIAYHMDTLEIIAYSDNIALLLDQPLSHTTTKITALFPYNITAVIKKLINEFNPNFLNITEVQHKQQTFIFSVLKANTPNMLLVIEPVNDQLTFETPLKLVNNMTNFISMQPILNTTFYNTCAQMIKKTLEYDRVMVYQFHEDYHGEVIGEAKNGHQESLLNYHFPASDIPPQARALYLKNKTRLVFDIKSPDVKLNYLNPPEDIEQSIDLGLTDMRALSPIHKEYLSNMGVHASLSISLIVKDRLWGMIICHNKTPKKVDYRIRRLCETMAFSLSQYILSKSQKQKIEDIQYVLYKLKRYKETQKPKTNFFNNLELNHQCLELIQSDYVAIIEGDSIKTNLPGQGANDIKNLLSLNLTDNDNHIFASHKILEEYSDHLAFNLHYAGLLMLCVSQKNQRYIIWFRKPSQTETHWGGNPEKSVNISPKTNKISPRNSFDAWIENTKNESSLWQSKDLFAASELRTVFSLLK